MDAGVRPQIWALNSDTILVCFTNDVREHKRRLCSRLFCACNWHLLHSKRHALKYLERYLKDFGHKHRNYKCILASGHPPERTVADRMRRIKISWFVHAFWGQGKRKRLAWMRERERDCYRFSFNHSLCGGMWRGHGTGGQTPVEMSYSPHRQKEKEAKWDCTCAESDKQVLEVSGQFLPSIIRLTLESRADCLLNGLSVQ